MPLHRKVTDVLTSKGLRQIDGGGRGNSRIVGVLVLALRQQGHVQEGAVIGEEKKPSAIGNEMGGEGEGDNGYSITYTL